MSAPQMMMMMVKWENRPPANDNETHNSNNQHEQGEPEKKTQLNYAIEWTRATSKREEIKKKFFIFMNNIISLFHPSLGSSYLHTLNVEYNRRLGSARLPSSAMWEKERRDLSFTLILQSQSLSPSTISPKIKHSVCDTTTCKWEKVEEMWTKKVFSIQFNWIRQANFEAPKKSLPFICMLIIARVKLLWAGRFAALFFALSLCSYLWKRCWAEA